MPWLNKDGLADVVSRSKSYAKSLFKIGSIGKPGILAPDGTSIIVDEHGIISSPNNTYRELTQAEYDALTEEEKNNGTIYFITDAYDANAISIDNALSTESTNAVQNKVITKCINDMNDSLDIVKAHVKATGNVHNLTPSDLGISIPIPSSTAPKANGTASAGTSSSYAREDHVHPLQTSVSGNAGTATKLSTERKINGMSFDGSADRTNYAICSTGAATVAKVVSCTGFVLVTGSEITVKFSSTNTASNPTLNVNSTGAKAIYYHGAAIKSDYLVTNKIYNFRYNGTQYEVVGDINISNVVTKTIPTSGWTTTNGKTTYSFESEYPFSQYDLVVEPNGDSITDEQLQAWSEAKPTGSSTSNQIIIKGTIPTVDIPVIVKAVRK